METSGPRDLKIRTTGGLNTVGTLFYESGQQLAEDNGGASGTTFAFETEVPAGVHYVCVQAYGGSATGRYRIEEHGEAVEGTTPSEQPGTIMTAVGTGTRGYGADGGAATRPQLNSPARMATDQQGNLYIADWANQDVRRVGPDGVITTVAGNETGGFSADGGDATSARLRFPRGVGVEFAGNLYIADTRNHRVRKVDSEGVITTVAGTEVLGYSGDGGRPRPRCSTTPAALRWIRLATATSQNWAVTAYER